MDRAVMINGILVSPSDPESMYAGWLSVERLAKDLAWKHARDYGLRNGLEMDDMLQQAYLTYDRVVRTFDPSRSNFLTFLACSIRDDFKYINQATNKTRMLEECESLDAKHYKHDDDSNSEAEYIPGGDSKDEAEESLARQDLKEALQKAFEVLEDEDYDAIQKLSSGDKLTPAVKRRALKAARLAILSADDDVKEVLREFASYI